MYMLLDHLRTRGEAAGGPHLGNAIRALSLRQQRGCRGDRHNREAL